MRKNIYFVVDNDNQYNKILAGSLMDEIKEYCPDAKCKYLLSMGDIIKSDIIIICGDKKITKWLFLGINILRKSLILYHVPPDSILFGKFSKKINWVITPDKVTGYDYFPSSVLLGDLPTQRHIERVWKKERMVSKRGCIGIIGSDLTEPLRNKLSGVLNLLIEDLDLNVVFMPLCAGGSEREIISKIKYSANIRYVQCCKYTPEEFLGLLSRVDFDIALDEKGAICVMAVGKPLIGLSNDDKLKRFLNGITNEEIFLEFDKMSVDELYSKIKIAWVHKTSIEEWLQEHVNSLRKEAEDGIIRLCREHIGVTN